MSTRAGRVGRVVPFRCTGDQVGSTAAGACERPVRGEAARRPRAAGVVALGARLQPGPERIDERCDHCTGLIENPAPEGRRNEPVDAFSRHGFGRLPPGRWRKLASSRVLAAQVGAPVAVRVTQ